MLRPVLAAAYDCRSVGMYCCGYIASANDGEVSGGLLRIRQVDNVLRGSLITGPRSDRELRRALAKDRMSRKMDEVWYDLSLGRED